MKKRHYFVPRQTVMYCSTNNHGELTTQRVADVAS
ncbi:hypothetical protein T03_5726 [Trichinella britovi]|uniref:Uncharacterized protein n=1 Tax=Trichinella britovi TaxID=45882 RepID=A0A0V0Z2N0_TRIBR|nr:hypothetical protein T03_5726 [Trichinella britovi]